MKIKRRFLSAYICVSIYMHVCMYLYVYMHLCIYVHAYRNTLHYAYDSKHLYEIIDMLDKGYGEGAESYPYKITNGFLVSMVHIMSNIITFKFANWLPQKGQYILRAYNKFG